MQGTKRNGQASQLLVLRRPFPGFQTTILAGSIPSVYSFRVPLNAPRNGRGMFFFGAPLMVGLHHLEQPAENIGDGRNDLVPA